MTTGVTLRAGGGALAEGPERVSRASGERPRSEPVEDLEGGQDFGSWLSTLASAAR